jgi:hypothetical protein
MTVNAKLQITSLEKYEQDLSRYFSPRQQMLAAMAGLMDDPLVWQTPTNADSAGEFLARYDEQFRRLDDPPAGSLPDRVIRLWWLLVRAKVEQVDERQP